MSLQPRAVLVHRRSEYDELVARHGTAGQAAHFLAERNQSIDVLVERHEALAAALGAVSATIPTDWRRAELERSDLARFVFGPEDVLVVVGQDGLVANVAKYLDGQPVVGINPEPARNPGVLVPHPPEAAAGLLAAAVQATPPGVQATMVGAVTDDGQRLRALNEVFIGHPSHQSARYRLRSGGAEELQSSSGLLVGTGTGATGWLRSVHRERRSPLTLPRRTDRSLCWFVREAWPSPTTATGLTEGSLDEHTPLEIVAESDQLVCFGDGIEDDSLRLAWGQRLTVAVAATRLNLVG
ncbi:MAG: hypothetical protein R2704_10860 [Microthrixaceae bacterium]